MEKKTTLPYVPRREAKIRDILGRAFAEIDKAPWTGSVAEWPKDRQDLFDRTVIEFDEWLAKVFD
jgi:hypothetical protein